jgi:hypothetical protein
MAAVTKKVSAPELRKSNDAVNAPIHYPFWFGGSASCFATFFTHPLDLSKLFSVLKKHWLMSMQSRYFLHSFHSASKLETHHPRSGYKHKHTGRPS